MIVQFLDPKRNEMFGLNVPYLNAISVFFSWLNALDYPEVLYLNAISALL